MKNLYFISIFILFAFSTLSYQGQIVPNGDFEEWETTPQFSLDPTGWTTGNNQLIVSISQDSMAYSNELAMKVTAVPAPLGAYGEAYTLIDVLEGIPESLDFHAKWDKTSTAAVAVTATFYTADTVAVYWKNWWPEINTSDWTPISISLIDTMPDFPVITFMKIHVESIVGDLVLGEGWISIDEMSLSMPLSISEIDTFDFEIGPNPASDYLNISSNNGNNGTLRIFDMTGKMVYENNLVNRIDVSNFSKGNYIIQLTNENQRSQRKFTIQ